MARQKFISYDEGSEFIDTIEDLGPDSGLRDMDERTKTRVENVKDMVLYRHGSTGVVSILQKAVQLMELTPVYIVRNVQTFAHNDKNDGVFREVGLAKIGSRIGDIASSIRGGEVIFIETGKDASCTFISDYLSDMHSWQCPGLCRRFVETWNQRYLAISIRIFQVGPLRRSTEKGFAEVASSNAASKRIKPRVTLHVVAEYCANQMSGQRHVGAFREAPHVYVGVMMGSAASD